MFPAATQDVILPRVLDDGTFATLSSLMLFNNVEVLMALTQVRCKGSGSRVEYTEFVASGLTGI